MPKNSESELRQFYENTLKPQLDEFEKSRKKALKQGIGMALVLVGLVAVFAFYLLSGGDSGMIVFQLLLLIGGGVLGYYLVIFWVKRGLADFKPRVVKPLIQFIDPTFRYLPEAGISQNQFTASSLFSNTIFRYRCEDLVMGTLGQTSFSFSEVHAEEQIRTRSGTHTQTIFEGLYFIADFNKHFSSQTRVLPDSAEKYLGALVGNALQGIKAGFSEGKLIKLEDPEFEKSFAVYSSDPIEARYILTPALMRRMLAMGYTWGEKPYFSFVNSSVHIAIPSYSNRFEAPIFGNLVDFKMIKEFHRDILMLSGMVEEMGLNTRIWSKAPSQREDLAFANTGSPKRVPCWDGACTGIVGPNGVCGTCGRCGKPGVDSLHG